MAAANVRRAPGERPGWQARFYDPQGHRRTKTFRTKADAIAWLDATRTDIRRGDWIDPTAGQVLFEDLVDHVAALRVGGRPTTKARDDRLMKTRVLPYFEGRAVGSLTRLDVHAWIVQLQTAGLAASTVRKCYQLAARVFDEALEASMIGTSPCRRIELPQEARRESVLLGADDVAALARAVPPRFRALILTAAYTGLRWGELAGLREGRVDLERRRIDVAEILIEVDGALSFGPPKTKKSRAQVSVPTPLVFVIRRHLAEHADSDRTRRLIFTSDDSTPLRRSNFRRRVWLPAIKAAGLPSSATFHALRHTCASWLIADGANPLEVAEKLRHTRVSTTLGVYGHLFEGVDQKLDSLLEARFASSALAGD